MCATILDSKHTPFKREICPFFVRIALFGPIKLSYREIWLDTPTEMCLTWIFCIKKDFHVRCFVACVMLTGIGAMWRTFSLYHCICVSKAGKFYLVFSEAGYALLLRSYGKYVPFLAHLSLDRHEFLLFICLIYQSLIFVFVSDAISCLT